MDGRSVIWWPANTFLGRGGPRPSAVSVYSSPLSASMTKAPFPNKIWASRTPHGCPRCTRRMLVALDADSSLTSCHPPSECFDELDKAHSNTSRGSGRSVAWGNAAGYLLQRFTLPTARYVPCPLRLELIFCLIHLPIPVFHYPPWQVAWHSDVEHAEAFSRRLQTDMPSCGGGRGSSLRQ